MMRTAALWNGRLYKAMYFCCARATASLARRPGAPSRLTPLVRNRGGCASAQAALFLGLPGFVPIGDDTEEECTWIQCDACGKVHAAYTLPTRRLHAIPPTHTTYAPPCGSLYARHLT